MTIRGKSDSPTYRPDWNDGQWHEYVDYDVPEALRADNNGFRVRSWSPEALWQASLTAYLLLYADEAERADRSNFFRDDFWWRNAGWPQ